DSRFVWFLTGHRTIDEIVEIRKDNGKDEAKYTVLFATTTERTDTGRDLSKVLIQMGATDRGDKRRVKAVMVYDKFLKTYIVNSLEGSAWDHEDWQPLPYVREEHGVQKMYFA